MVKKFDRNKARIKRHGRVRRTLSGTPERPRLCVYRSNKHIFAQIIDDVNGVTLVSASTTEKDLAKDLSYTCNKEAAKVVGAQLASKALDKGIDTVVFDRSGYLYHGKIKELAESARAAGLKF